MTRVFLEVWRLVITPAIAAAALPVTQVTEDHLLLAVGTPVPAAAALAVIGLILAAAA
jgi:hypothetical protein